MTEQQKPEVVCRVCSTPGSGRFCASCGASLESSTCAGCGGAIEAGAKFCHNCGRPVGRGRSETADPGRSRSSRLPWVVAGVAIIALIAYFGGGAYGGRNAPAPQTALDGLGLPGAGREAPVRGPDISQLTPQESADRLYNRVMLLAQQGKADSVLFFAPMAISAYEMMSPLNADQRYDIGHIAEVAGAIPMAKAQADTILAGNPTHLLGLILGARVASLDKNETARRAFDSRILSVYDAEMAKGLPEYERHADEIARAVSEARRPRGGTT
ncbi:MAG: double zinc ribbon domain-containing protein [Gemmatimonadaceae bacterium]